MSRVALNEFNTQHDSQKLINAAQQIIGRKLNQQEKEQIFEALKKTIIFEPTKNMFYFRCWRYYWQCSWNFYKKIGLINGKSDCKSIQDSFNFVSRNCVIVFRFIIFSVKLGCHYGGLFLPHEDG